MRKFPFGVAVFGGLAALAWAGPSCAQTAADAAANNDSAYTALRVMAKALGKDSLEHVVEVTGRDGVPQPYLWKIVLQEGASGSHEVDVAGGKIAAERTEPRPPASKSLIHLQDLNLDSSGAFDATDAQARKVRLRFDSVNYVLRASESTGKPQWSLSLFNQEGVDVGTMRLAANDGNIVSIEGKLASSSPASTPTSAPVAAATPHRSEAATPRATEPTIVRSRPKESPTAITRTAESRTTTITTSVNPTPPPPPVATITDTVTVDDQPVDRGEGGLFTRTGRTLDKTSRNVQETLRKTGSRLQRFFTGHIDTDQDGPPPPPPPPPSRDPNYRGD